MMQANHAHLLPREVVCMTLDVMMLAESKTFCCSWELQETNFCCGHALIKFLQTWCRAGASGGGAGFGELEQVPELAVLHLRHSKSCPTGELSDG